MNHDTASPETTACHDDSAIADDELLWRLVNVVTDAGADRPESGSLRDVTMSVNRATLSTLELTLCLQPDRHIAQFTVADVRQVKHKVYADPVYVCLSCRRYIGRDLTACPNCGSVDTVYHNKAHAIVCPKMSGGVARGFAKERAQLLEISQEIRNRAKNPENLMGTGDH